MSSVLKRFENLSGHIYVDGGFRRSAGTEQIEVIEPATESVIGTIAAATPAEIDQVVTQANATQKSWAEMSALDRAHALHKTADEIEKRTAELAEALTREMGKPYKESLDEVAWSVHSLRYSAEIGRSETGRVMGPAVAGQFHYTLKQPLGTAVLILPFNYPMVLLAWEAGAALAAGNAVVVKPSEYTTITTMLFAEAFSHLPAGLFQVVSGAGEVGRRLVEHPDTHVVAFTGSVPVGRSVASTCGDMMKRCLIENSGNDPVPGHAVRASGRGRAGGGLFGFHELRADLRLRRALLRPRIDP
jgi:acyl-CoA reductase-like NAD-dependent aldehyde dehydrogenase